MYALNLIFVGKTCYYFCIHVHVFTNYFVKNKTKQKTTNLNTKFLFNIVVAFHPSYLKLKFWIQNIDFNLINFLQVFYYGKSFRYCQCVY